MKFIELNRRFRNITEEELRDPELLFSFGESFLHSTTDDWTKLFESRRVVLLAEAGSGKTEEMKAQVRRLKEEGKYAFYADLASLDREPLPDLLSADDECAFSAWKAESDSPAWFFLDSVDELKLTQGKLKRAVNRFAKDVYGLLDRIHVIISCRPSDWKFDLDVEAMQNTLPILSSALDSTDMTGEELFLAPFRRNEGNQQDKSADEADEVRTVIMLPLTPYQIETYANRCGVQDAETFMEEIQRQEAWLFANRPLDCGNLVQTWNTKGKLGTRVEQHEANIAAKLKDDPERPDNNLLTSEKAREGAERLALALALTRTRTVLAPGHDPSEGVLDSVDILTDWTPAQRNALLRRGLFDPATYGRIRFHHRSVEEYLAACHFRLLRKKGMSIKSLKHFFFAERYGAEVVIPSMRPIAAWLALWNEDIRRELIRREPEVLLAYGDPGDLSIEDRAELLRAFAAAYGDGGWRGISISIGEIRRLSHPALAPVIRELWEKYPASKEVCDLLLELIWQGSIKGCADIAREVAWDVQRSNSQREDAVFGLVACNEGSELLKIAKSLLAEQEKWPDKIVPELAQQLFPAALSVQELIVLIDRTPQPESAASGFAWYFRRIAENIDQSPDVAVELRKAIAKLIWQGRNSRQEGYWKITGKYSYLPSGLAILCEKQLAGEFADNGLIWACAVANRFGTRPNQGNDPEFHALKEHFKDNATLREKAFWIEADLMSSLVPAQEDRLIEHAIMNNSLLGYRAEADLRLDQEWLFRALKDTTVTQYRHIALEALLLLWHLNERSDTEAEQLRQAVADDSSLTEKVKKAITPKPPNPEEEKWRRRERRQECDRKGRERQRMEKWQKWREEVLADTNVAFSSEQIFSTLRNLYHWLNIYTKKHSPSKVWNKDALIQAFNKEVASRAAVVCKKIWRDELPVLWSNRSADKRGHYLYIWHYGLFGLAEESSSPGWSKPLNTEEAKRAAAYATIETSGFAPWLVDLAEAHPDAVKSVLGDELDRELLLSADESYLPALNNLACCADVPVKQLLTPRLCAALLEWDSAFTEEKNANFSKGHLDQIIKILNESAEGEERAVLSAECAARFSRESNGPLALSWLKGLFHFDPVQGVNALEQTMNAVHESERIELAVRLFANGTSPRLFEITDQTVRANMLKRLLLCAHTYIRPEQDNIHDEGVYTPDARDNAERVRSRFLESLIATPGGEAHKIILELTDDQLFADSPDWLRFRAREQAAKDAEFDPYEPAALGKLEKKFEAPPRSRDELFGVMIDRLEDIQHDIAHHDFNIRQTLRTITDEEEMQRYLAKEFDAKKNGAYTVARENEKADKKRTDIELTAVHGKQKVVIEIKLAIKINGKSRWSITDFQRALRHQLVGQYLRHESCKAGCLLLTCNGSKKFWIHPETKKRVYFPELIKLLQDEAEVIKQEKNHEIRLAVFGLDLTDPHLEPAHESLRQLEDQMDIEDAAGPEENIPAQEAWKELGV